MEFTNCLLFFFTTICIFLSESFLSLFISQFIVSSHQFILNIDVCLVASTNVVCYRNYVAAYNELRNEKAKSAFGKDYAECDEDEQKAIREFFPQKISEAEPKKYGGK